MQSRQPAGRPSGHDFPANSRKNSMQPQNVKNEMLNTSQRDGAPGALSNGVSSIDKAQKLRVYRPTSRTIRLVLFTALLATPFMLWVDIFFSRSQIPMQTAIALAIKLVIVGISHWLVNSVMGSPLADGGVGAAIVSRGGLPTHQDKP